MADKAPTVTSTIDKKFHMDRQGKDYILFAGLLDKATEMGIKRLEESVVQIPSKDNEYFAVCASLAEDAEGRIFRGVGDASPGNVNRNIASHILRMAGTRAKARALRDMLNIGGAAYEELGPDDAESSEDARQTQRQPARADGREIPPARSNGAAVAPKQSESASSTATQLALCEHTRAAREAFFGKRLKNAMPANSYEAQVELAQWGSFVGGTALPKAGDPITQAQMNLLVQVANSATPEMQQVAAAAISDTMSQQQAFALFQRLTVGEISQPLPMAAVVS